MAGDQRPAIVNPVESFMRMFQIGTRLRISLYLPSACGGLDNLFNLPAIAI
jgi:hypothetical protein